MTKARLLKGIFVVVVLIAAWWGARPARQAIKGWQARRTAREALALIQKGNFPQASEKARDSYQLAPAEPEGWRAVARLLGASGDVAGSLDWWKKLEDANQLTLDDRRAYAAAALTVGDLVAAAKQIEALLAQPQQDQLPTDKLFAGQLAARRGDGPRAVDYADRTLGDNRVRPYEILSSASLIMSVTSPESAPYANAWKRIEDLARDPDNPASLDALVFVAEQQPPTIPASEEKDPLRQMVAPRSIARMPAIEVAERLEKHPAARPAHQVLALKVRAREFPSLAPDYLKEAVTRFRDGNDETLIALSNWLSAEKKYETVLEILPLDRAIKRRELFVQRLDALEALGRFDEVRDLALRELSPLDRLFRQIYLATAREKLGETAGAANEWQNALSLADNANKCLALGNYAERSGPPDIADAAYARALSFAPNLRAGYDGRLRIAETRGETAKALEILGNVVRFWPEDEHARGHENYLRLLLGAAGAEAEKAVRDAEILVAKEPRNWRARATLALGRLRLNQPAAALQAFSGIRAVESSPPGALAVRAVALDANGWKDGARGDARTLAAANLLPEERALIAPLLQ